MSITRFAALFLALLAVQVLADSSTILKETRAQAAAASWGNLFIVAGGLRATGLVKPIEMVSVSSANGRCTFARVETLNIKTPRSQLAAAAASGLIMFVGGKYVICKTSRL